MDLLQKAHERLGSDAAIARYLKISQPTVAQWRANVRPMPPLQAAKLAELLEMNPGAVFLEKLLEEYEKKGEGRNLKRWFKQLAASGVAVLVALGLSGGFPTSGKANNRPGDERSEYTMCLYHLGPLRQLFRALHRSIARFLTAESPLGFQQRWPKTA